MRGHPGGKQWQQSRPLNSASPWASRIHGSILVTILRLPPVCHSTDCDHGQLSPYTGARQVLQGSVRVLRPRKPLDVEWQPGTAYRACPPVWPKSGHFLECRSMVKLTPRSKFHMLDLRIQSCRSFCKTHSEKF